MREIKFRGKRVDNGEWVFGHYCTDYYDGIRHLISEDDGTNGLYLNPETVGQFTGIQDANDVYIYEGDIVRDTEVCVVKYSELRGSYTLVNSGGMMHDYLDGFNGEIIGNVHDNPELLK